MIRNDSRIIIDDEGVRLIDHAGAERWRFPWAQVKEIVAWKDDVFAYDILCLGFRVGNLPEYFACDEEQHGWGDLLDAVEQRFGVKKTEWRPKVVFPAFASNWTVLWEANPSEREGTLSYFREGPGSQIRPAIAGGSGPVEWFTIPGRLLFIVTSIGCGAGLYGVFFWAVDNLPRGSYPVVLWIAPIALAGVLFFLISAFILERMGVLIYRTRARTVAGRRIDGEE